MAWKLSEHIEYDKWKVPTSYIHTRYYDAYNIFFRLENSLRHLVYSVVKSWKGDERLNA